MVGKPAERLWLSMADSPRTRVLSKALAKGMDMTVYLGPTMDPAGPVAMIIADDAHANRITEAKTNAAPGQRSILVTQGGRPGARADIYLAHDTDAGSLVNAVSGLSAYRSQELALSKSGGSEKGAVLALSEGEFRVRTLVEAQHVAVFLARCAPKPVATAVGLYALLASAIEHGNLEFSAEEKAQGLAEGKWEAKLAKRLREPGFAERVVKLRYQRGRRLMSLLIQDDGEGIDAETAEMANPTRTGHRGRGIKLAKGLGFANVSYLGIGNTVEASMVLPEIADAGEIRAAG